MNMHRTQIRRASLVQKVQQHRRIEPAAERNPDARARRKWRQLKLHGDQCTSAAMPPEAASAERRRCGEGDVSRDEVAGSRSEAHTSEPQEHMRNSLDVFSLKNKQIHH